MEQVIFKYLRAEPEDHYFLLVSNAPLKFVGAMGGGTDLMYTGSSSLHFIGPLTGLRTGVCTLDELRL